MAEEYATMRDTFYNFTITDYRHRWTCVTKRLATASNMYLKC